MDIQWIRSRVDALDDKVNQNNAVRGDPCHTGSVLYAPPFAVCVHQVPWPGIVH